MDFIDFSDVKITGGFWKQKQDMIKNTTLMAVYNRFSETHRFDALKCDWKEKGEYEAHIFWDSDVAKWIEGAAYVLSEKRNAELERLIDEAVDNIADNADENGYFNSYYLVTRQDERFMHRSDHELYCLGHLIEAAVAYNQATGKDKLLKAMCRYADYVEKVFRTEQSAAFLTPGHPELELALVKLYKHTGEKRYLELSKFFIDKHGDNDKERGISVYPDMFELNYNQDEVPIRERSTVEGHSVRALYLLSGAADIAVAYHDKALESACRRCFDNAVNKRMYITGGLGSTHIGETFTIDYHLPNRTAYAETCAAIALAMYSRRMQQFGNDAVFADTVERTIYNGVLSGISMDGKSFFYENPLEVDPDFNDVNPATKQKERYPITERLEVFGCSCCPPNIIRFLASISGYIYSFDNDTLYIDQYIDSITRKEGFYIRQTTCYPADGKVKIQCICDKEYLALRIPQWCDSFRIDKDYELKNGYAFIKNPGNTELEIIMDMPVKLVASNRRVHENAGKIAVMRGPVVYCAEAADNGKDIISAVIGQGAEFGLSDTEFILPSLKVKAMRPKTDSRLYYTAGNDYEQFDMKLIPYYAFANRGASEMTVWFNRGF